MKNRLTNHAQFWRDIGASPWVMRVIEQGYSLPFLRHPHKPFLPIISLLLSIKLFFLMKPRDSWRQVVFVKLSVMKRI